MVHVHVLLYLSRIEILHVSVRHNALRIKFRDIKCPFWPKKCVPFSDPRFNTILQSKMVQSCRNTLEFCQTSVWQNSRFCRTEQNFVGPNFLKSLLLNYVRYYFQSLKGKKYSIYIKVLRVPTKQRDDIKSNCCHIYYSHLYSASFHPSNGYRYFFINSVGHLVRHSNIFCRTFIRNVRLSDRSDEFRHHWW